MKKSRFTEAQIVSILKEYEAGKKTTDICREQGISVPTFYQWRRKYGGMDNQQLKELKALQEENARLKRMFADLSLDHRILKDIIEKKALKLCERKALVEGILKEQTFSVNRACRIVCLTRSMYYYVCKKDDEPIIEKLSELSEKYPTRGFDTYYGKIRLEGLQWNRKRVLRVYRKLNLKMRRKRKRRIPSRVREPLVIPVLLNDTWSVDFMSDSLENGRRFRVLNVIDDCNREALINEASFSIPAERLVDALKRLFVYRNKPKKIRVDNGPEFLSKAFTSFCSEHQIELCYIQPGKPSQNAYIERFNRTFREDVLDAYLFSSIQQVNAMAYEWQIDYNANHPHKALAGQSPWLFMGSTELEKLKQNNYI